MPIILLFLFILVLIGIPAVVAINVIELANNGVSFWPCFWLAIIFFSAWAFGNTGQNK